MITAALILAAAESAPSEATGGNQLIIAVLGAGSFGAILAAIITGLFSKRKLGAEATEIITKAASGVVESLNAEILRVTGLLETTREEQSKAEARHHTEMAEERNEHAAEMEEWRRVLQLHVAWDLLARAKLAEHGIELPEPPGLLPPLRRQIVEGGTLDS